MHVQRHQQPRAVVADVQALPIAQPPPRRGSSTVGRVAILCVVIVATGVPLFSWSQWEAGQRAEAEEAHFRDARESLRKTDDLRKALLAAEHRLGVLERLEDRSLLGGTGGFSVGASPPPPKPRESDLVLPKAWLERIQVVLYSRPGCTGKNRTFTSASKEEMCNACLDTCTSDWQDGSKMHGGGGGSVKSLRVFGNAQLFTHSSCIGAFSYPGAAAGGMPRTFEDGCVEMKESKEHFQLRPHPRTEAALPKLRRVVDQHLALMQGGGGGGGNGGGTPASELGITDIRGDGDDRPVSRFQSRDWMPPRTIADVPYFRNWTNRFKTPEADSGERLRSCGNAEADAANAVGVELVRRHVELGNAPEPVPDPSVAEEHFLKAIELAPSCATPVLNLAILMFSYTDRSRVQKGYRWAVEAKRLDPDSAKVRLWLAFHAELQEDWPKANMEYFAAFDLDNELPVRYFGRPHKSWGTRSVPADPRIFYDPNEITINNRPAHAAQEDGVRKLLLYMEYADYFGGYGAVSRKQAEGFLDNWYIHLSRLIPPYCIKVVQDIYRPMIRKGWMRWDGLDAKRHTHHNGPMQRLLEAGVLPRISRVAGYSLIPTYAYMGAYWGGAELAPHLDREQCEYTLSITVDSHPESAMCSLGVADQPNRVPKRGYGKGPYPRGRLPPPKNRVLVPQYLGDGALIRGRAVMHWRQAARDTNCTQFFFHYVLDDFKDDLN